jgi:hypothetical protein
MTERQAWIFGAATLGVGYILYKWGNPVVAAQIAENWAVNLVGRGNVLSQSTDDGTGVIEEIPDVLNTMASGVLGFDSDVDTYSLARMGRSEGVDGMEYRMHIVLNDIASLVSAGDTAYSTITKYMTYSRNANANGHYSAQNLGKRVSTSKDPYEADYALAQQVIADHDSGTDPTNGATKFVDKSGPFYVNGAETDYDGLVAAWATDGLTPMNLPNATSNFVVFVKA